MATLLFSNINKVYKNGVHAVKNMNLDIKDKEFIVLVGPSGCGKSTVLRMVAGLEDVTSGDIYISKKRINNIEPKKRNIAMVFQNYALYPHMSVYDNMAFGLKMQKNPRSKIKEMVLMTAKVLGIEDLLQRKPQQLSGGQKQRVALGRAIVREPQVFLMDEPLSNLDAKLRVQMRTEIINLHKRLNATFIYVTHDQTEAMTMGSRIAIMKDGMIQQIDTPKNIYNKPANIFVASFIGSHQMNFIEARVLKGKEDIRLEFFDVVLHLHRNKQQDLQDKGYIDRSIILGVRAEHINLQEKPHMLPLTGEVEVIEPLGAETFIYIKTLCGNMVARTDADYEVNLGDKVNLYFDASKIHIFDPDSGGIII